jgi:DNA-binding response OmpR family regulator
LIAENTLHSNRPTVLVVDDQPPLRRFIVRLLAARGYDILEADHAAEALVHAARRRIDLLITDVVMAGTSGPELVKALANGGYKPSVLMMSGHGVGVLAGEDGGCRTPFLQKPFTPGELIAAVEALLNGVEPLSPGDPG